MRLRTLGVSLALVTIAAAGPKTRPVKTGPDLRSKIDAIVAQTPWLKQAFLGIDVVALPDGRALYQRDAERLFAPASNTKLFTTALALSTLGPQYRFTTTVVAQGAIDASGRLAGDLVFVGGGDPSLSARRYPYQKPVTGEKPQPFETIPAIEDLADQIASRGIKAIDGDIVGDDRRYVWDPYPDGWSADDAVWEYGAPVSALIVNDNAFTLWIRPGAHPGDLVRILTSPAGVPFTINNRVQTIAGGERKIHMDRLSGSSELDVWGTIPESDEGMHELLAVNDPAVFAAFLLRDALTRRGIAVRGDACARHGFADTVADMKRGIALPQVTGTELARRTSPPLNELLQVTAKVSQNLHAEIMLREVGAVTCNMGTREAGHEEMKAFLAQAGIGDGDDHLVDGSGLSRLTLVTPVAVTKLLTFMYRSKNRQEWIPLLPIAGVDGTLRTRFDGHPEAARIHAKTGSLSHVRALSGYAESETYGPLAFSIIVNDSLASSSDISTFLDKIGLKLVE